MTKKDNREECEVWKDVVGYEGYYQVSDYGRVRSLDREVPLGKSTKKIKGKIRKQVLHNLGYPMLNLYKNKEAKGCLVHRLVALHFVDNVNGYQEINHINGIKDDNRATNLEWCTRSQNLKHARDTGLTKQTGTDSSLAKLTKDEVLKIRKTYEKDSSITYEVLASAFNVGASTIGRVVRREVYQNV